MRTREISHGTDMSVRETQGLDRSGSRSPRMKYFLQSQPTPTIAPTSGQISSPLSQDQHDNNCSTHRSCTFSFLDSSACAIPMHFLQYYPHSCRSVSFERASPVVKG